MNTRCMRVAAAAASLPLLLALAACGRVENTQKPMPGHANVEINRQGMVGAKDAHEGIGVVYQGESRGARRPG
jgi:hypothetical protein